MTSTLDEVARAAGGEVRPAAAGGRRVDDVVHDSRAARPGVLFVALAGTRTDGHDHVAGAVAAGASALLVHRDVTDDVPRVVVPDTAVAVGPAAAVVHGHPSQRVAVVGVTGTNGKTTTTTLVEAAAAAGARGTAVVGTTGARIHGAAVPSSRTTPVATDLQRLLARVVDRGVDVAALEVSSHGLALHRVDGTRFRSVGFTMLGEDHLDFHRDREDYLAAKQRLFTAALADRGVVVVDDEAGRRVAAGSEVPVTTLSVDRGDGVPTADADVVVDRVRLDLGGGRGRLRGRHRDVALDLEVRTRLPGAHNLANAALALLLAVDVGVPPGDAAAGIAACPGVAGRMQPVRDGSAPTAGEPARTAGEPDAPRVFVDYAHTPDAIRTAVAALRDLAPAGARVVVVVGAGGDRDPGKRPGMGAAAARADLVVLTSDNPRREDPATIVDALAAGAARAVAEGAPAEVVVELDRAAAIRLAVDRAGPGDVVLVAGKGHETGQEFADRTEPFDDRLVAAEALRRRDHGADA